MFSYRPNHTILSTAPQNHVNFDLTATLARGKCMHWCRQQDQHGNERLDAEGRERLYLFLNDKIRFDIDLSDESSEIRAHLAEVRCG